MILKYTMRYCPKCGGVGQIAKVAPRSLKQVRCHAGLTIKQLADKLGVSTSLLHKVEEGIRTCTPEIERAYARL